MKRLFAPAILGLGALGLSGCVSLGAEVPDSLLTLSPTASAPIGAGAVAGSEGGPGAIAVMTPEVPAKLDVLRVPVDVNDTQIAYLPETFWVEKPARLFRRLLGETLRAELAEDAGADAVPLVLDNDDTPTLASLYLRGSLSELGYDAQTSSVVVRFDAIRSDSEGQIVTKRFEARESGVVAEAASVGPALNRAANTVAAEVADWMTQ